MEFIDFFSGIGGFRRGLEMAGHKCIGFCEYDKYAIASYTSMHLLKDEQRKHLSTLSLRRRQKEILKEEYRNGEWFRDDIRKVHGKEVPKSDCWCFGAPCQSFSLAGKKEGLDGQSGLIREIFRILGEIREDDRPEWIIYENVKGMFSSNRGLDYLAILIEMDGLGYDVQWQNFNSKYYVPQNRERIYTVGHLRSYGTAKIFPIEGTDGEADVRCIKRVAHANKFRRYMLTYNPSGIVETLDTGSGGGHNPYVVHGFNTIDGEPNDVTDKNGIYVDLGNDCVVYAVWYEKYNCYISIRKLTPKECFRLQGWTDDYFERAQFINTDSQLYKQAGNGVTVNIVYELGQQINSIKTK